MAESVRQGASLKPALLVLLFLLFLAIPLFIPFRVIGLDLGGFGEEEVVFFVFFRLVVAVDLALLVGPVLTADLRPRSAADERVCAGRRFPGDRDLENPFAFVHKNVN